MTNSSVGTTRGKRILVTGGAGEMARYACAAMVAADDVELVIVSDRDLERAAEAAAALGPKARPAALDISDNTALRTAMAGVDVVLNCAGPFYLFGVNVLSSAIATGTHYLDIADDWEPTLEMLKLDEEAREAGITAVIGMGSSPGISNLLALLCMNELDTVERVFTAWRIGNVYPPAHGEEDKPNAARDHWVHNCTEPILVRRGGRLVDSLALEEIKLSYPGVGEDSVWVCGHPEPITLSKFKPEIQESYNVMVARRGLMEAMRRLAVKVRAGELDVVGAGKAIVHEPNVNGDAAGPRPIHGNLFSVAEGIKDGRRTRVGAKPLAVPQANMGEVTGYPLAVAALMVCRGQANNPGVHGPEGAVDPHIFFKGLADLVEDREDGPAFELVCEEIV